MDRVVQAGSVLLLLVVAACARPGPPAPVVQPDAGAPAASQQGKVVVGKGDSFYAIARRHGVSIRDLIELNDARPPYRIHPGETLLLPEKRHYRVVEGDYVSKIARCQGVDLHALIQTNDLHQPYLLTVGQRLRLPVAVRSPACPALAPVAPSTRMPPPPAPKPPLLPTGTRSAEGAPSAPPPLAVVDLPSAAPSRAPSRTATPSRATPRAETPHSAPTRAQAQRPVPPPRDGKRFLWPAGGRLLSNYGKKSGGLVNDGINILADEGTQVTAADSGVVVYAGDELPAYGNLVLVRHSGGWTSAYAHNAALNVARGERVARGQVIATVGQSGNVNPPQLHFELRKDSGPVDPLPHLAPW